MTGLVWLEQDLTLQGRECQSVERETTHKRLRVSLSQAQEMVREAHVVGQ